MKEGHQTDREVKIFEYGVNCRDHEDLDYCLYITPKSYKLLYRQNPETRFYQGSTCLPLDLSKKLTPSAGCKTGSERLVLLNFAVKDG